MCRPLFIGMCGPPEVCALLAVAIKSSCATPWCCFSGTRGRGRCTPLSMLLLSPDHTGACAASHCVCDHMRRRSGLCDICRVANCTVCLPTFHPVCLFMWELVFYCIPCVLASALYSDNRCAVVSVTCNGSF